MRKLTIGFCGLVIVALGIVGFLLVMPVKGGDLASKSPIAQVEVRGLPFKGSAPHALDGALRLYIGEQKRQTDIPFGLDLNISWSADGAIEIFSLRSKEMVLMKWRMEPDGPICIAGAEHLAPDPYLTK